jgi:hypothetical protein
VWPQSIVPPELVRESVLRGAKDRFHRASDKLLADQEQIEAHLRRVQRQAFSLERTIFLHDLTNTHFEGAAKRDGEAQRRRSKHKSHDCEQLVIGIAKTYQRTYTGRPVNSYCHSNL